jgi:hypothetical protein
VKPVSYLVGENINRGKQGSNEKERIIPAKKEALQVLQGLSFQIYYG